MHGDGRVYLRGTRYWIEYWHNGTQYRESSRSHDVKVARDLLTQRLHERNQGQLSGVMAGKLRMSTLFAHYLTNCEIRDVRSLERSIRPHLKPVQQFFAGYRPDQITPALIEQYQQQRKSKGRAVSTINLELRMLRTTLRFAHARRQILFVPAIQLLPGEHARQGFFEWHELEALLPHLPPYLRPAIQFAFWVGWRKHEVFTLEWQDIDWIHGLIRLRPVYSKTEKGRSVGMSAPLREILTAQWAQRRVEDHVVPYVFHRKGKRILRPDKSWRKACALAGIPGKILHDFRRTAARNMVFAGNPPQAAMAVTGHKSLTMFTRYVIVAPEQTAIALEKTAAFVTRGKCAVPLHTEQET